MPGEMIPGHAKRVLRTYAEDLSDAQIKRAIEAKRSGCTKAAVKQRFRSTWDAIKAEAAKRNLLSEVEADL
jgi:hypothetical protein